jgi:hypothetical protein
MRSLTGTSSTANAINDTSTSPSTLWSSSKIENEIASQSVMTITGLPTQVAELAEWDDVGTEGVNISPGAVNFTWMKLQRCVSSKGYFIPAHIEVGGWIKFQHTVSNLAGPFDTHMMYGVHFKNESTVYASQGVGIGESEYYHWLNADNGNLLMEKGIVKTLGTTPPYDHQNGNTVATRVTRTSEDLWTIEYSLADSQIWYTQINETCTFGSVYALRHCHVYMGILNTDDEKSQHIYDPVLTYDKWNPTTVNYAIGQNTQNTLVCSNGGDALFLVSNSDCHVATPMHAAGAITQLQDRFDFPVPVVSTFYVGLGGVKYKANNPEASTELHVGEQKYGSPLLPRLRSGNVIEIDMTGICRSNGTGDEILYLEVYLGEIRLGHSSSTNKMSKSGTTDRAFNLHITITTPSAQFVRFSIIPVRMIGLFSYHNYHTTDTHIISGFGLEDVGASVTVDDPGELRIVASWLGGTSSACQVEMMSTRYSVTGFNT